MVIGISVFEIHLPQARSLKQKRKVVKSLIDRIHSRLRVSVAETDHHDRHQRSEIAVAAVARSEGDALNKMDALRALIDQQHEAILIRWDPQILEDVA